MTTYAFRARPNVAAVCFCFDSGPRKDQFSASTLGAVPKKVRGQVGGVLGGIERAYEDQRIAVGGRGPELCDIEKMLQTKLLPKSVHSDSSML